MGGQEWTSRLRELFLGALRDPHSVAALLYGTEIDGAPVHHFPAPTRPDDGHSRLGLLLLLRSTLADLIARPDLVLTGRSRIISPEVDGAADHDLLHDVVIEQGDLDLEVSPSVALARFGIHASGFGGIDPDPLYAGQTVLVGCQTLAGVPVLLRAHLTTPIHDTEIALPSSDVRDDLEGLRERIWRQYAYTQLAAQLARSERVV